MNVYSHLKVDVEESCSFYFSSDQGSVAFNLPMFCCAIVPFPF